MITNTQLQRFPTKEQESKYQAICHAAKNKQKEKYPAPVDPEKRLGYAVVGLGKLTLEELLPALSICKYSKLAALVSGDGDKARKVAQQYGIPNTGIYNYQNFDDIKNNPEVDVVYIVLPNSMHHEFTIRAAKAGKHVLCEKPMANTVKECEEMITACQKADRKLMIAYRIQYEAYNALIKQWTREEKYGKVKIIEVYNGQNLPGPNVWRAKKSLGGGGALPDIGIYCLNTIRYLLGEEPTSVLAHSFSTPGDARFREVEESMLFQLTFPSGALAMCGTSYGTHMAKSYKIYADEGYYGLDPAFSYSGLQMHVSEQLDTKIELKQMPTIREEDQFAVEMDHFSECIACDKQPYTPGEEGLQDMKIIEAIYQSAYEGRIIKLDYYTEQDVFRGTDPIY
ncbi:MAG: yjhC [Cytophagaceae bacterium]|jgi:predicted dehydrogenase|nr:yjhC [Cytophagaceae bacterium]